MHGVLNLLLMYNITEKGNCKRQGMFREERSRHEYAVSVQSLKLTVFVVQFIGAFRWV